MNVAGAGSSNVMASHVVIEGILEKKQLFSWQSRKFALLQDGSFQRFKGNQLRSTAMVKRGTSIQAIGSDQFSLKGLMEEGRNEREYLLKAPSSSQRDDWVSKFEIMLLFVATNAPEAPRDSAAPSQNTDNPHVNVQQSPEPVVSAADACDAPSPSPIVAAAAPHPPASPFEIGVRASQLLEFCSSPELPQRTGDLIRHLALENNTLGGSLVQQFQRSGASVGTPTVMVCHSHDGVWKETIAAVCKFCNSLQHGLDTVVWIDVLCFNHAQAPNGFHNADELRGAVSQMDHVLMVSAPWHSPLVCAWMPSIWMMYSALTGPKKKLSIVLTDSESSNFASTASDHTQFVRFLVQFSCQDHLQSSAADSFRECVAQEGLNVVDKCIVDAMDAWFVASLQDVISVAAAENDDERKVCMEQSLARFMSDSELCKSSSWKMLDKIKSERDAVKSDVNSTPAPPNTSAAHAAVDLHHHHRQHSDAELAAIEESKIELEIEIIRSVAEKLLEASTIAEACRKSLEDAASQSVSAHKAKSSSGLNDAVKTAKTQASVSSAAVAAAPARTRNSAASSVSPIASQASVLDSEDDSAFDETKTPDAPVLKYGRNGVPELRQLYLSEDRRFLCWKGKKGFHGSVDLFQLSNILLGQQTETFKLLPSTSLALVSFSLVLDDRTLDCVAKSVKERRWWCAHIQYVHKALRPHGAKSIAESLRKQQQVGKRDKLDETSKTQLHALFLELLNGRQEEKMRNHRKHALLVKYGSVLDAKSSQPLDPRLTAATACVNALKAICAQQAVVFIGACAAISAELEAVGKFCVSMVEGQVALFTLIYLENKELSDDGVIACLESMTDARDKALGCDEEYCHDPSLRSHFVMLSSAAPAFCWVCHPGLPAELVTDVLNALPVFGQRLEALGPHHVEFFDSLKGVLRAVLLVMNQYHANGVAWSLDTVTCSVVQGRFRSSTDENKIFQTDVDFVGIHAAFVEGPVERLVQASKLFSEYLQKQILLCKLAFIEQKNIVARSRQHLPPRTPAQWEKVLHNLNLLQANIEDMSDNADARVEGQDSILALRLMTGAMGCVSWLTIDLNPHLFLTDVLSGLSVYGDKLLALDDGSGRCSEFVGAAVDLVAELAALVKTNHSHGLVWNPRGEDLMVEELDCVVEEEHQADS